MFSQAINNDKSNLCYLRPLTMMNPNLGGWKGSLHFIIPNMVIKYSGDRILWYNPQEIWEIWEVVYKRGAREHSDWTMFWTSPFFITNPDGFSHDKPASLIPDLCSTMPLSQDGGRAGCRLRKGMCTVHKWTAPHRPLDHQHLTTVTEEHTESCRTNPGHGHCRVLPNKSHLLHDTVAFELCT